MVNYPIDPKSSKEQLFALGVENAKSFLDYNKIAHPAFHTYAEVLALPETDIRRKRLKRLINGPKQGYGTGWYYDDALYVNLKKAAHLQQNPRMQLWSFPGYKVDRTPYGVVAHEVGHHVDDWFGDPFQTEEWEHIAADSPSITSYEPVPWEAGAETMRLFITNPDLLYLGSRPRYDFILNKLGLKPHIIYSYSHVLGNHPAYCDQALKWIRRNMGIS